MKIATIYNEFGLPSHEGSGLKSLEPAEKVEMPLRLPSHEGSGLKSHETVLFWQNINVSPRMRGVD